MRKVRKGSKSDEEGTPESDEGKESKSRERPVSTELSVNIDSTANPMSVNKV